MTLEDAHTSQNQSSFKFFIKLFLYSKRLSLNSSNALLGKLKRKLSFTVPDLRQLDFGSFDIQFIFIPSTFGNHSPGINQICWNGNSIFASKDIHVYFKYILEITAQINQIYQKCTNQSNVS